MIHLNLNNIKGHSLTAIFQFIFIATFLLGSCSKNKDHEISIVGKWNGVGYEQNDFYNGTPHYSSGSASSGSYIEFKANKSFIASSIATFSSGTWNMQGDKITLTGSSNNSETWVIKKLASTELVLYQTDKDMYPTDYYELTVHFSR